VPEQLELCERKKPQTVNKLFLPFKPDSNLVPPMALAGEGFRFHVTGLTHDEYGYPTSNPEIHEKLVRRLIEKVRRGSKQIVDYSDFMVEDAEVVVFAYGSTARAAVNAVLEARKLGIKAGMLRLKTLCPLPEEKIREIASKAESLAVAEVSYGQLALEIERIVSGIAPIVLIRRLGGEIPSPTEILQGIKKASKNRRVKPVSEAFRGIVDVVEIEFSSGGHPQELDGNEIIHPSDELLRVERFPHVYCSGCGIGIVLSAFIRALKKSRLNLDKVCVVSGIGCTGRLSGYLKLDGFHVTHGRAIPFATGLKIAKPELEVIVVGGDGDLLAIGGNHSIHAARRNIGLLVICVNNFNYGLTGGQVGPTTPLEAKTTTSPYGSVEQPFNIPHLAKASGAVYVARWTVFHTFQLEKSILECLGREGFRLIEVISPCPTNFGRRNQIDNITMMKFFKEKVKIVHGADTAKAEIKKLMEPFIVGKFVG
jgi:2-oxoglutarate ferredoxin oxidoreductase subunit beta